MFVAMFRQVQMNQYALRDFMESEGLRLTDLAEKAKVSKGFLSELRSGTKTEVSEAVVKRLADALNVRPKSLVRNPDAIEVAS